MCSFLRRWRYVGSCLRSTTVAGFVPFVVGSHLCKCFCGQRKATEKVHIHLGIVLRRREKCVVLNVVEKSLRSLLRSLFLIGVNVEILKFWKTFVKA